MAIIIHINYNIGLFLVILLFLITVLKMGSIVIGRAYYYVVAIYMIILIYSIGNPVLHIDFKYHLAFFLIFFVFDQVSSRGEIVFEIMFKAVFWISLIVFSIYILLFFDLIPNIFLKRELAEYQDFRVTGPSLIIFLLLPLIYSMKTFPRRSYNKYLLVSFILGLIACGLSGSNRILVLFLIFYTIAFAKLSLKNIAALLMIPIFIILVGSNLSERHIEKSSQILNPSESQTIITRISDLKYAYNKMKKNSDGLGLYIGEGIGVRTEVLRNSWEGGGSYYYEFHEIDNGFYYVFHRAGFIGLTIYTFIFIFILFQYGSAKNKLMFGLFFVITNALSIHYFTSIFYALVTYVFIKDDGKIVRR